MAMERKQGISLDTLDVVEAVYSAAKCKVAEGEIFHVGSGKPTTINELAETILELTNSNVEVHHEKPRDGEIKYSYADISKSKRILGYEPKVSLRDGLQALLKEKTEAI